MYALASILLFVAIGPLVGLIVFVLGMSLSGLGTMPLQDVLALAGFFFIYGIFFAHFLGAASAAIAGIVATTMALAIGRAPVWIGPLSGAVAFGFAWLVGMVNMSIGAALTRTEVSWGLEERFFLMMAITHILTSTITWQIARPLISGSAPAKSNHS